MSYCDYFADQLEPDDSVDPNYPIPITTTSTPTTKMTSTTDSDVASSTTTSTTSVASTSISTTDIAIGTCSNVQSPETAALIVGGFFDSADQNPTSLEVIISFNKTKNVCYLCILSGGAVWVSGRWSSSKKHSIESVSRGYMASSRSLAQGKQRSSRSSGLWWIYQFFN